MFYLINKPIGITSFDVIRKLRKILGTKKIGHTGTLDPLATGCLLIATDNSTKLIPLLEKLEKTYTFKVRIDGITPSLDLGTEIIYHSIDSMKDQSKEDLIQFLSKLDVQTPPKYSALKVDGVRSYELARKGEDVILKERSIRIQDVKVLQFQPPFFEISLRITSGGYIRSLAESIGQFFGVPGGYVTELRRDAIHMNSFSLDLSLAQELDSFDQSAHIPYETLFTNIVLQEINENIYTKLQQGKVLEKNEISGTYNIGQNIFLRYGDHPMSLMEYSDNGFQIIRNNV